MKVTIFNAQKSDHKFAWSPYDDLTFIFQTLECKTPRDMYNVMVQHWILNIPLEKLTEPVRSYRRKAQLKQFYSDELTYFIIDLDEVKSKDAKEKILQYFKKHKCIIGESRSHNNKDNFNMKGILLLNNVSLPQAKSCIAILHDELKEYCKVDKAVARMATLNAPIGKNNILLDNSHLEPYVCPEECEEVKQEDLSNLKPIEIPKEDVQGDTIEEYCLNIFKNMEYTPIKSNENGSIVFKHPSEQKSVGGYFWFKTSPYTMHHFNPEKSINIFDAVRKTERGKELMERTIDYDDAFLQFDTNTEVITTSEKYLEVKGKEQIIQKWLETPGGLFSIKSPMGTGKSTIIKYIIDEAHELDMKVLIVTNRRSVAADFAKKYNIKLYSKDEYKNGDSIIVQFDSLWKYNVKNFDMVVMDEFISLMMHSRSNLNNSGMNLGKFFGAFQKKLVIADAFLTGYENFLLSHKTKNIVQLNNTYRDGVVLYDYQCKNTFVKNLIYDAGKPGSLNITISSTSSAFIEAVRHILQKRGLRVITLTGSTPDNTKELIYELLEKEHHDKWDVFMYSPTLTVGVSNLNKVYKHYHWDTSMSTDVVSSIQMMKRTRKAKEIHMYVATRKNYLKTTYDELRDSYMKNIGKASQENYLFDVDGYGEPKLSMIGRNAVKIDTFKNILEFNHKQAMMWLLKYHFLYEPREVTEVMSESILSQPLKQIKANKTLAEASQIEEYFSLTDIAKTDILMDVASSPMQKIAEIDDHIKTNTPKEIRMKIISLGLKNTKFIQQCRYYKVLSEYSMNFLNGSDVKYLIQEAVLKSETDDMLFFNKVLERGPKRVQNEYYFGKITSDLLKFILGKVGYRNTPTQAGVRMYKLDETVKDLYGYIK